jgi:hypothetical protein
MKGAQTEKAVRLTVRGVPAQVKNLLVRRAGSEGKSLNTVLVEVLQAAAELRNAPIVHTDLDALAGLWVEDPDFEDAIRAQDQMDHCHF